MLERVLTYNAIGKCGVKFEKESNWRGCLTREIFNWIGHLMDTVFNWTGNLIG